MSYQSDMVMPVSNNYETEAIVLPAFVHDKESLRRLLQALKSFKAGIQQFRRAHATALLEVSISHVWFT